MRLEQADDLLGCGHLLALQHATRHVLDHLRDQRHQFLQPVGAAVRDRVGRRRQGFRRLLRLVNDGLGQVYHVPLRRLQRIGSRLAFLACHVHDVLHPSLGLFGRFLQVLLAPPHRVRSNLTLRGDRRVPRPGLPGSTPPRPQQPDGPCASPG